jgi:hypothetical protein
VAYVDFVGSGIETVSHIVDNGRIVVMFCAFEGPPKILRLHGRGRVVEPFAPDFDELLASFDRVTKLGLRSIVQIDVTRISDSCGYAVPLYRYEGERDQLTQWAGRKGSAGLEQYKVEKNLVSIDGLEGLRGCKA